MLYQFFIAQWKYPAGKNEWTQQVKMDLTDFDRPTDLEAFKAKVKRKSREFAFFSFLEKKESHSGDIQLSYKNG